MSSGHKPREDPPSLAEFYVGLARAGFRVEALFGGFVGAPFAEDSRDIIFIARSEAG
jgi:hypothetical protein